MAVEPIADARVWNHVRALYLGAGLLFLVNIGIGVLNVFTEGAIERGQVLAHFHAGTIGWITLSVIATTIWVYTGQRNVSSGYATFTLLLAGIGIASVAGYVGAFWLTFQGHAEFILLPTFGIPAALTIWGAFLFAAVQLKAQAVRTTAHWLLFCGLLVASLGVTVGILLGLSYAGILDIFPAAANRIGAHAGPMDMYLALAFAGILEFLTGGPGRKITGPGIAQAATGTASALVIMAALLTGVEPLIPIAFLLFLTSFGFYFARIGWRPLRQGPTGSPRAPALFFAAASFPLYVILFVILVVAFFVPGREPPHAMVVAVQHLPFVGLGTNVLLATQHRFTEGLQRYARSLPAAYWTLNVGLVLFVAAVAGAGVRHGALVMAAGILWALFMTWVRLAEAAPGIPGAPPGMGTAPPPTPVSPPQPPA